MAEDDVETLAAVANALADAIEAALPGWVERSVERIAVGQGVADGDMRASASAAGRRALAELGPRVRSLLAADVDEQRTNPLSLLRGAVRYPTEVLAAAGVPPVPRGEFEARAFPEDVYDLAPATWADVDPSLREPGIVWGAAKAHVVLRRRRERSR